MKLKFAFPVLLTAFGAVVLAASPRASATTLEADLGDAANYAVLYEGDGGHNFQLTSDSGITGNVGIGDPSAPTYASVQMSSSTITGNLDFAGLEGGSTNLNGTITGSVNTNVSAVTSALSTVNSLSASLGGLTLPSYANLTIDTSSNQTITLMPGVNCFNDGAGDCVFNVTSFNEVANKTLTINGNGTGLNAVFDVGGTSNFNIDSGTTLEGGLTSSSVLFNFYGGNFSTLSGNGNLGASANNATFDGIILDPNGGINFNSIDIDGQVFGGDSADMQIVSNAYVAYTPSMVPEPSSLLLFGTGLLGLAFVAKRRLAA